MRRSLEEIQQSQLDAINNVESLQALEILTTQEQAQISVLSNSKVGRWRQIVWITSFAIWLLEELFDILIKNVKELLALGKIHGRPWYRKKAINFRYGQDLIPETDEYTNEGLTVQQIEASKIIKHAAIIKITVNGRGILKAKVARDNSGVREPLTEQQNNAFSYYMNEVADAGTYVLVSSLPADDLKLELLIYYDPLVLDNAGKRLDGTDDTPVINSCIDFTRDLQFNGEFIKTNLKNYLSQIDGVKIPVIKNAWSKYGQYEYETQDVVNVGVIDEIRVSEAGYMKLDEDNIIITYVAKND